MDACAPSAFKGAGARRTERGATACPPWRSLSAARWPVRWSKKRLSLREFARIRPKPSNSDGFWTTPPQCRPDAAKPRRILDHSAHRHQAHARDPRMRHPHRPTERTPARTPPSAPFGGRTTTRRHRRPAGHEGNCEWMGGLPPVPHPADAVGGMGSRVRTYSGWPPAAPKAPYYRQVPIYRRGDDADDARNHGDPHRGASESACFQRYGHERDREGLTNNGEGEVIGCHA